MRRLTDLLEVTGATLAVASASVAGGLWAGLAAGAVGCFGLSWSMNR